MSPGVARARPPANRSFGYSKDFEQLDGRPTIHRPNGRARNCAAAAAWCFLAATPATKMSALAENFRRLAAFSEGRLILLRAGMHRAVG